MPITSLSDITFIFYLEIKINPNNAISAKDDVVFEQLVYPVSVENYRAYYASVGLLYHWL